MDKLFFKRKVQSELQSEEIINQITVVADDLKVVVEGLRKVLVEFEKDEHDPTYRA